MIGTAIVIFLVIFLCFELSIYSTTVYLHRAKAHRSIKLHPAIEFFMQLHLWLFTGLVTREWVAVHRKHHQHFDREGDPHSPQLEGLWNILLWNIVYYARARKNIEIQRYTKDIPRLKTDYIFDHGWYGLVIGFIIFIAAFGFLIGGWMGMVIGACAFLVQGVAYTAAGGIINGAGHAVGYRNFNNTATNIACLSWVIGGEPLHNNHHSNPHMPKFSVRKNEFDPAWLVIKLLNMVSLATVPNSQIES